MEDSSDSPALQPQEVPVLYPATSESFLQVTEDPVFAVQMTRTKSTWLLLLWSLALVLFVCMIGSLFLLHSAAYFEWSGIAFMIFISVGTACSVGLRRSVISVWRSYINTYFAYTPVIGFSVGVFVRQNSSDPNFIFLPWNAITTASIEQSPKTLLLNLSYQPAPSIENPIRVSLEGAIINSFGIDTPEKIAQAIQSMIQRSTTDGAAGLAPQIPSSIASQKDMSNRLALGLAIFIFIASFVYMWYKSH